MQCNMPYVWYNYCTEVYGCYASDATCHIQSTGLLCNIVNTFIYPLSTLKYTLADINSPKWQSTLLQ